MGRLSGPVNGPSPNPQLYHHLHENSHNFWGVKYVKSRIFRKTHQIRSDSSIPVPHPCFFAKKQQSTAAGRFLRDATAGTSVAGKFPTKKVMICVLKVGILATNSVIIIYIYIMHHQKSRCDSYNIIHIIHRFDFWWSPLCSRNLVPPPFIPLGLPPRWGQRSERWKRLGVWGVQLMI